MSSPLGRPVCPRDPTVSVMNPKLTLVSGPPEGPRRVAAPMDAGKVPAVLGVFDGSEEVDELDELDELVLDGLDMLVGSSDVVSELVLVGPSLDVNSLLLRLLLSSLVLPLGSEEEASLELVEEVGPGEEAVEGESVSGVVVSDCVGCTLGEIDDWDDEAPVAEPELGVSCVDCVIEEVDDCDDETSAVELKAEVLSGGKSSRLLV